MSSKEKRILKIVFLGDCNVGKSSIISTCVSDENGSMLDAWKDDQSRFILYPVLLRSETSLSTYDTILVDTYGGETKKDALKATISSAQSIILVYDLTDPKSFGRLMENWLPLINEFNETCPIIIVGNKQDLAKQDEDLYDRTKIKKIIVPILREFPQVELGIECSAREGKNIVEALYCAQCVYLFPLGPLYIQSQKDLTEKYKKTLTTIFRILDKDGDGKLSDFE
jgi:Ras family protein T1